jgi:hypothetical protein
MKELDVRATYTAVKAFDTTAIPWDAVQNLLGEISAESSDTAGREYRYAADFHWRGVR